jgi:hypothetical protein
MSKKRNPEETRHLLNLTPHPISLRLEGGVNLDIPPSGLTARCDLDTIPIGHIEGDPPIPVHQTSSAKVRIYNRRQGGNKRVRETMFEGGWKGYKFFIVSARVASCLAERDDILVPHHMVRDDDGQTVGCRAFACVSPASALPTTAEQGLLDSLMKGESVRLGR